MLSPPRILTFRRIFLVVTSSPAMRRNQNFVASVTGHKVRRIDWISTVPAIGHVQATTKLEPKIWQAPSSPTSRSIQAIPCKRILTQCGIENILFPLLLSLLSFESAQHIERKSTVQFLRNVFQKDKYARVLIQSAISRVHTPNTDF